MNKCELLEPGVMVRKKHNHSEIGMIVDLSVHEQGSNFFQKVKWNDGATCYTCVKFLETVRESVTDSCGMIEAAEDGNFEDLIFFFYGEGKGKRYSHYKRGMSVADIVYHSNSSNREIVYRWLISKGMKSKYIVKDTPNTKMMSNIFLTARTGNCEDIKRYLACGFPANKIDGRGETLFHIALRHQNFSVIDELLKWGSSLKIKNIDWAFANGELNSYSALKQVISESMKQRKHEAEISKTMPDMILSAVTSGNIELIKEYISYGMDPCIKTRGVLSLLDLSRIAQCVEISNFLGCFYKRTSDINSVQSHEIVSASISNNSKALEKQYKDNIEEEQATTKTEVRSDSGHLTGLQFDFLSEVPCCNTTPSKSIDFEGVKIKIKHVASILSRNCLKEDDDEEATRICKEVIFELTENMRLSEVKKNIALLEQIVEHATDSNRKAFLDWLYAVGIWRNAVGKWQHKIPGLKYKLEWNEKVRNLASILNFERQINESRLLNLDNKRVLCKDGENALSINHNEFAKESISDLVLSIKFGNVNKISEALANGLSPNTLSKRGATLLYEAVSSRNFGAMMKLLEYKADPLLKGNFFQNAIDYSETIKDRSFFFDNEGEIA